MDVLIAMEEGQDNFVQKRILSNTFNPNETELLFNLQETIGDIVKSGKTAEAFASNLPPYKLY